jgi:outer membrane immunogenic protein
MRLTTGLATLATLLLLGAPAAQAEGIFGSFNGSWTGLYAGGQAALLATKSLEENAPALTGPTLLGDMGGGAGVFAGVDYQFSDMFVAGVMGELNTDSTTLMLNGSNYGSFTWNAAARARLGALVAPNVLAYGSVGWDWGHFDYSAAYPGASTADFTTVGMQYGIGVDVMLTGNIMGRLDATYSHYGSHDISTGGTTVTSTPSIIAVKAGIGLRF